MRRGCVYGGGGSVINQLATGELGTIEPYHFHILQNICFRSLYVGLYVDVWHVTPVVPAIVVIARGHIRVVKGEAVDARPIHDRIQIVDLALVWCIPIGAERARRDILSLGIGR